jgi:hypothetical protein
VSFLYVKEQREFIIELIFYFVKQQISHWFGCQIEPPEDYQQVFQDARSLVPTSRTWGNAQAYETSSSPSLSTKRVHAFVTGIQVSGGDNTVRVSESVDLSILFPSVVSLVLVTQTRVAKIHVFTH